MFQKLDFIGPMEFENESSKSPQYIGINLL